MHYIDKSFSKFYTIGITLRESIKYMQVITTVTQKGQVTLPKQLREAVGIHEYDKVLVESGQGYLKIMPTVDILDLAGTFKSPKKKLLSKAREAFEKNYQRF